MAGSIREKWKRLKTGEKVFFGFVAVFILIAIQNFVWLEHYRKSKQEVLYPIRTHYDFAGDGFEGSVLFRTNNCTLCHRAVGNGTNMGVNLDGIGSLHDEAYLYRFLKDPEATYPSRTLDHGPPPKEAAYVGRIPDADLHKIAVFLSQLKADRGSPTAVEPPRGQSSFIDSMLDMWAPDSWRSRFKDIREGADTRDKPAQQEQRNGH
jgi:cytochrome c553